MKQFLLTPSAGKRLIAKALAIHPSVQHALKSGTLVIVAGTTNGYFAEEILISRGVRDFSRQRFFRGVTMPPNRAITIEGRLPDESQFPGDVIISGNVWQRGKSIGDVVNTLRDGDVIVKGANAVDLVHKQAALLIGHPRAGTAGLALPAVFGQRVKLIVAAGLEKRISGDLQTIALKINAPGVGGYRFLPLPGELFTELEAFKLLCGAEAELIAAGGVDGAEGACWIAISGSENQEHMAEQIYTSIANEPPFTL
ncbi:MAG: hypothetical protein LBH74_00500 [Nitrososphaerota archaeon]|jgi:hypothetical protein|uniref:hypothetical protein n=1 Tax=Candidatus Bathycorpusculum sp. TaxID=2994959 RepID=UPI002828EA13|nr:hypothetical protein [Candidatus Termitimicrobium sp.]MCL2431558.1 hypothetical protein [Candidatus Termitimicrobium sp.]MDR0492109.1 hypothetical protein [Nitrososphaerota archaeon]